METVRIFIVTLVSVLILSTISTAAQDNPSSTQLAQYYQNQLESKFYGDRMDSISGLGHLGDKANGSTSRLVALSKSEQNNFYRLLLFWTLAEIGTYEASDWSRNQALKEKPKLMEGPFREVAARTVLLSTVEQNSENMFDLNRALPKLYNKARDDDDLTEKLTAIWALFQMSTAVTIQTAERSITPIAERLSPEHPNYTRHLRYIRLIGPSAQKFLSDKLESLLKNYGFFDGITPKRALTAYTLAVISYPDQSMAVMQYKDDINQRLKSVLDRGQALDDAAALGPFAYSEEIVNSLQDISLNSNDESDQEEAEKVLSFCR